MNTPKLQFIVTGFSHVTGVRVFAFDGIAEDRSRMAFTVSADVALARSYGIRIQELSLLCRGVLERAPEGTGQRTFTYDESEMSRYAAAQQHAAQERVGRRGGLRSPSPFVSAFLSSNPGVRR